MLYLALPFAAALLVGHGFTGASRSVIRMDLALTPTLIDLGCDEELWSEVRNKQALLDMSDDEDQCRKRIEFLRKAVASGDDSSAAPRPRKEFTPFELYGEAPEGVEVAEVEALLEERIEFKKARDYEGADMVQAKLKDMGIFVNDRQRTWSKAKAPNGGFSLKGPAPEGVDVQEVEALLDQRREAKKARDFESADEIQEKILAMGVFVNDKERTWMARKVGRKSSGLPPYTLSGAVPEGVDVAEVDALLEERIAFKKVKDFDSADVIQKKLLNMGVYVNDKQRIWEEAAWVKKKAAEAAAAPPAAEAEAAVASE